MRKKSSSSKPAKRSKKKAKPAAKKKKIIKKKAPKKKPKKTVKPQHDGPGAPTKYLPEYCDKIIKFMEEGGDEVFKPITVSQGKDCGSEIVDHLLGKLPAYFEKFAHSINVHVDTLHEWKKNYPEFSEAYKRAKQIQLTQMLSGGLAGVYPQAAFIFAMKNIHKWRDQQDLKHEGGIQTGYSFTELMAIAGRSNRDRSAGAGIQPKYTTDKKGARRIVPKTTPSKDTKRP